MKKNVLLFLIFVFNFSVFAENFSFQIFQHSKGISSVFEEVFEFVLQGHLFLAGFWIRVVRRQCCLQIWQKARWKMK